MVLFIIDELIGKLSRPSLSFYLFSFFPATPVFSPTRPHPTYALGGPDPLGLVLGGTFWGIREGVAGWYIVDP